MSFILSLTFKYLPPLPEMLEVTPVDAGVDVFLGGRFFDVGCVVIVLAGKAFIFWSCLLEHGLILAAVEATEFKKATIFNQTNANTQ